MIDPAAKVNMNIRPARIETDLPAIVRIVNPYESHPVTVDSLRSQFQHSPPERMIQRLVSVDDKDIVTGYAYISHPISAPENHFYAWVGVAPAHRRQGIGAALWSASLDYLQAKGASRLASECMDYAPDSLAFAQRHGFTIDRHHYASALDLSTFDEMSFLPDIASLEAQGIRFCSLADIPDTPETQRKFYELNLAVVRDIPGENWDFDQYSKFFAEHIVGAKWFNPENQLLAVDGETFVGLGSVRLFPEKQSAYNATTGVIREYRGRKIGLALKVMATRYARQHGATQVTTDNDSLNAPILAINRKMGYLPLPGQYILVRWL